jgi:hypothetical protein|tara:strand:+ start:151 stop:339 length:189 start_codon:yes stop_codon:yes gene_type:complete
MAIVTLEDNSTIDVTADFVKDVDLDSLLEARAMFKFGVSFSSCDKQKQLIVLYEVVEKLSIV